MRKDVTKLGYPLASFHALNNQELNTSEYFAAYNAGKVDNDSCIDDHDKKVSNGRRIIAMLGSIMQSHLMCPHRGAVILL